MANDTGPVAHTFRSKTNTFKYSSIILILIIGKAETGGMELIHLILFRSNSRNKFQTRFESEF